MLKIKQIQNTYIIKQAPWGRVVAGSNPVTPTGKKN